MHETIRGAIRQDGRTLGELAADADVDKSVLSRFMRGERGMNLDVTDRLCRALGLELVRRQKG